MLLSGNNLRESVPPSAMWVLGIKLRLAQLSHCSGPRSLYVMLVSLRRPLVPSLRKSFPHLHFPLFSMAEILGKRSAWSLAGGRGIWKNEGKVPCEQEPQTPCGLAPELLVTW